MLNSCQLFPLRLLGMGLLLTWDWSLSTHLDIGGMPKGFGDFNFTSVAAQALTLVVLALLSARIGAISRRRGLFLGGAAAGTAGPLLLLALQASGLLGEAAGPAGAVALLGQTLCACATGFSTAVLLLAWAEVYGRMEPGRVMLYGALSLVFGVAVWWLIHQSSPWLQHACVAAVPLASFVMCALSLRFVGTENPEVRAGVRYTFPWKPVLIMGVCGFAAAFVDIALFDQGTLPHILADAICGGVLALVVAVLRRSVRPVVLVGISLACMAAGILAVAARGTGAAFLASTLTMLSYVVITFFTYALLANKCYRHDIPSLWLFGFAAAARVVMDHVGGFSRMAFPDLRGLASSQLDLAIMAAVGLVVIGVVAVMWMSERSFNSSWAIERLDATVGKPQLSEHEVLMLGCGRVAADAGLTEREAQILSMLVEGSTYQQVCSALTLSSNTVKTHARHAYGKLGVHTREEAVELARKAGERG